MYDDTCRFLAEHFSADFASWLIGEAVTLTELKPSELSLDPIRADAMILLQSKDSILHIEFQTLPKKEIPFRMLDYRVRGQRRYKGKTDAAGGNLSEAHYLSELAYQTAYVLERTHHEFDVIRLWEQSTSVFLQHPGLLPFAVLGQTEVPAETLRQATELVDQIEDTSDTGKPDGSLGNFSWVKIRAGCNLQLSTEGHYARICHLPLYSGRNRGERQDARSRSTSSEMGYRSKLLPVEPDYRSKKCNNFSNNSTAPHKAEVDRCMEKLIVKNGITTPMQRTSKVFALRFWLSRRR